MHTVMHIVRQANCRALDAFIENGAINCPRALRLNAVAPALVTETATKAGLPLAGTVAAAEVAAAYVPARPTSPSDGHDSGALSGRRCA